MEHVQRISRRSGRGGGMEELRNLLSSEVPNAFRRIVCEERLGNFFIWFISCSYAHMFEISMPRAVGACDLPKNIWEIIMLPAVNENSRHFKSRY